LPRFVWVRPFFLRVPLPLCVHLVRVSALLPLLCSALSAVVSCTLPFPLLRLPPSSKPRLFFTFPLHSLLPVPLILFPVHILPFPMHVLPFPIHVLPSPVTLFPRHILTLAL
ncbi:hypothetical protein CLOP_g8160, partial [Closterium sp. NIES-67]